MNKAPSFKKICDDPIKYAQSFPFTVDALIKQKNHESQMKQKYDDHLRKLEKNDARY